MLKLIAAIALVGASIAWIDPASAQANCAGIADRTARLDCFDRMGRTSPHNSARPVQRQENCTPSAPCIGPRGGVYYITASGNRRYLPRR